MNLLQLWSENRSIAGTGDWNRRVWEAIEAAGVRHWRRGDPVSNSPVRLLVGLASYSKPDLELAQEIIDRKQLPARITIDLFDILDVRDMADFENFIPGIGNVYGTPVAGLWRNGHLIEKSAKILEARRLIQEIIGAVA